MLGIISRFDLISLGILIVWSAIMIVIGLKIVINELVREVDDRNNGMVVSGTIIFSIGVLGLRLLIKMGKLF